MRTLALVLGLGLLGCGSVTAVSTVDAGSGGSGGGNMVGRPDAGSGGTAPEAEGGAGSGGATADAAIEGAGGSGGAAPDSGPTADAADAGGLDAVLDAGAEVEVSPCGARFNFEGGATYGAKLAFQTAGTAFTSVVNSNEHTACGWGALKVAASFTAQTGPGSVGAIMIELPVPESWAGKTVSVQVSAAQTRMPGVTVALGAQTASTRYALDSKASLTAAFLTLQGRLPANAPPITGIVIEGFETSWTGTLYIDEIDVR